MTVYIKNSSKLLAKQSKNRNMHEKKIENILGRLSKIIDTAPNAPAQSNLFSGNERVLARGERYFYLINENLDDYNQVLKELINKEKWGEKFSEKYIDKILVDTIFDFLENGIESATGVFRRACHDIENFSVEQTIYIPLGGISMYDVEDICLGRIKITKITEAILKEIIEATKSITRTTKNSLEEQDSFIQKYSEDLSREFLGKICAIYRAVAEPFRALELAEQETQRALDLLRYSIPVLHRSEDRVRIGLSSQVPFGYQPAITLSSVRYVKNSQLRNFNYEISTNSLEVLKKIRVFELSDLLKKSYEQVNEFEKILVRGIHWFARSQTQVEIENEFLNLTTCLEVFFTSEDRDPISNSIAEGVALVLGKDLIERKRLKKRVKELYKLRSRISHGGHSSVLDQDMVDLKFIAMSLLAKMTEWRKVFSSRNDLMNWIENQKLS